MSSDNSMSVDGTQSSQGDVRSVVPNFDLNCPPPCDSVLPDCVILSANSPGLPPEVGRGSQQQIKDAIEILDDDVAIIDQDTFTEAKNNAQRNHSRIPDALMDMVVDAEYFYHTITELTELAKLSYMPAAGNEPEAEGKNKVVAQNPPGAVVERHEFNCPICMGTLNNPTATRCGHIFCKECISTAILTQGKCPTCRKKLGKRGIFRVYLPSFN